MAGNTAEEMISKLEDLVVRSKGFQQLERELAFFCPFEAVGMTDQEVRHAHFLAYILDPNRPHGFDDAYLRGFLHVAAESAAEGEKVIRPIDIHLMDLSDVRIERERDRIDLLIKISPSRHEKEYVLVFELKINASEGKDQLQRYEKKIKKRYGRSNVLFFFLTLNGDDPSDANRNIWTPISLESVIDNFEEINQRPIGDEGARKMVGAYNAMMRRRHVGDKNDRLLKLSGELWAEHKEALEFLASTQPDNVSNMLEEIFHNLDAVCRKLSVGTGWSFESEGTSSKREIILAPKEFDHINIDPQNTHRRLFSLVVDRNYGDRDRLRFRWLLRPGDGDLRQEIYRRIDAKKRKYTPDWTQIFVSRMDIDGGQDWAEISKSLMIFVQQHQDSMSNLLLLEGG